MRSTIKKATKRIGRAFGVSDIRDDEAKNSTKIDNLANRITVLEESISLLKDQNDYLCELIKRTHDITKVPSANGIEKIIQDGNYLFYKKIAHILKQNNITFFVDFGLLIGIERHGDFIPWDDDIDISVPREDYEKLFRIFDNEFKNTKIKYVNSEIIRIYYDNTPLQVDIFPIDFVDKKTSIREKKTIKEKVIKYHSSLSYNWNNLYSQKKVTNTSYDKMREKYHLIVQDRTVTIKEASIIHSAIIHSPESPRMERTYILDYEDIFPLKTVSFRDTKVPVPNKTQELLYKYYGDYYRYPNDIHHKHSDIESRITPEGVEAVRVMINKNKIGE